MQNALADGQAGAAPRGILGRLFGRKSVSKAIVSEVELRRRTNSSDLPPRSLSRRTAMSHTRWPTAIGRAFNRSLRPEAPT